MKNWWIFDINTMGKCAILSELSRIQVLFFILNESDGFPSKLIQKGFAGRDVDRGKLDTTDVGTCHCNLFHGIDTPDSFN